MTRQTGIWEALPPKTNFFLGLALAVLSMCTVGFFIMLSFILK